MIPWWGIALTIALLAGVILAVVFVSLSFGYPIPGDDPNSLLLQSDRPSATGTEQKGKRNLFLTYKSRAAVPQYVWDDIAKYAPDFQVRFFDDAQATQYLEDHFVPFVANKYSNMRGAHAADLFRFAALFREGGVYLDIKTVLKHNLSTIFPVDKVTVVKGKSYPFEGLHIGILGAPARHPAMGKELVFIVRAPPELLRIYYHWHCTTFMRIVNEQVPDAVVLTEECNGKHCDVTGGKDRYGFCCIVKNGKGETVMLARDPKYPY